MRSIKPEFWDDRKLARSTSRDARMLYVALWNQSDEHGRLNGDVVWLKGRVFPYEDDIAAGDLHALLAELESAGRIVQYRVDGDPFIYLPKLAKHQRLEGEKVPSRLPSPDDADSNATQSAPRANESAQETDQSENDATKSTLSMLHVAGGMEQVSGAAPSADAPKPRRATRLPEDWAPTEVDIDWQRKKNISDAVARREFERFVNYWRAKGSNATKLDWSLTWHNWLLDAADRAAPANDAQARARIAARAADPLASAR